MNARAVSRNLFDLSPWQAMMVEAGRAADTSAVFHDRNLIRLAYRVTPSVELRRLRRAFDELTKRHDSLRLRFREVNGAWRAEIQEHHPLGLRVEDLGEVAEADLLAVAEAHAAAAMSVFADALFEMIVLRCGRAGDIVVMRAHHAVVDGYGAVTLMEDLVRLLLGVGIDRRAVSHGEFLAWRRRANRQDAEAKGAYWAETLLPVPSPPKLGRLAKGKEPADPRQVARTIGCDVLNSAETERLAAVAGDAGVSVFSLLISALAEELCIAADTDDLILFSVAGRYETQLAGYVGPAMTRFALRYRRDETRSLPDSARSMQKSLRESLAHLPALTLARGGEVDTAFRDAGWPRQPVLVHIPEAQGQMRSSPVGDILKAGRQGGVSFGHIHLARLPLAPAAHTDAELQLSLNEGPDGQFVAFGADADAYTENELMQLRVALRERLGELNGWL